MSGGPMPGGPIPPPPPPGGGAPGPEPERITVGAIEADPRIMSWCQAQGFGGEKPDSAARWLRRKPEREEALIAWLAAAGPGDQPAAPAPDAAPMGQADRQALAGMLAAMIHEPVSARLEAAGRVPPPVDLALAIGEQSVRLLEKYGLVSADLGPEVMLAISVGIYAHAVWKAPKAAPDAPTTDEGA